MAEKFPRWNLSEVNFVEADADTIKSEIITAYESASGRSLATGDPVRLFLLTIANVIIQQRNCINIAGQQNLLSYAQGEFLDALGINLAVERLGASSAVATFRFTLSETLASAYTIPQGFEITNGSLIFRTDDVLTIPAGNLTGEISATCTTAGGVGNNYLAGQISTIVSPMTFLDSAMNTTTTSGGADVESDESYAERLRLAPSAWSSAGSRKAYIYHARSASSAIVDVVVLSPNPGEVKIYVILENGELPSSEVLSVVEEHLSAETVRPLTDEVEVLAPITHEYAINIEYWISADDANSSDSIQTAVAAAVEKYRIWQQSKIGRDITPDQLICDVLGAGAKRVNFSTLTPSAWLALEANEIAQCTSVTITYKGIEDN